MWLINSVFMCTRPQIFGFLKKKCYFELIYLCIFIGFQNDLYPIQVSNISLEDGGIVSKIYYFNLMVSYLYFLNAFISINKIGKYLALLYNSMESRQPWRTHIRVKGSDRRQFILILDSILEYKT